MDSDTVKQKIYENKELSVIAGILLLIAIGLAGVFVQQSSLTGNMQSANLDKSRHSSFPGPINPDDPSSGNNVEVKEANIDIKSESIENDIKKIETVSKSFNGFLESSSKTTSDLYINADLTVRIPKNNFSNFTKNLKQEFDVESYTVRNYKVSTERTVSEIRILNNTLKDYDDLRRQVKNIESYSDRIELLKQLTDKEKQVAQEMNNYLQDLDNKKTRSELATVDIRLEEQRDIELVPDDLWSRLKSEVQDTIDSISTTLLTTFTDAIDWMFTGFKILMILIGLGIPGAIGYELGKKAFKKL
ncbi:MAG: DUF4349 domain-containing protein [Nanohaloarchaea archaeon]|nr:DUF4349 domain-containing protein [Candidatus Nanohaloarchaea archaeon]